MGWFSSGDVVEKLNTLLPRWVRLENPISRQLYAYALLSVVAALLASWMAPLIPAAAVAREGAARDMLSLLSSTMLVVSIFALGALVTALSFAANLATPRAARVLLEDATPRRVVSTFLGAFVFGTVGLFAESFGYYDARGEIVILIAVAVVNVVVIVTFFRWIDNLVGMVRLGETIRKVEALATRIITQRASHPGMGSGGPEVARDAQWPVTGTQTAYVVDVDVAKLQGLAERCGGQILVECVPGTVCDPARALASVSWEPTAEDKAELRAAFKLDQERSFHSDPRFCVAVLAEIASRALSPGVNDSGTALGVVTVLHRLMILWADLSLPGADPHPVLFPRVHVVPLQTSDLFSDAFLGIVSDGAGRLDVGLRLQKSFVSLSRLPNRMVASQARIFSAKALRHAKHALRLPEDYELLTDAAAGLAPESEVLQDPDGEPPLSQPTVPDPVRSEFESVPLPSSSAPAPDAGPEPEPAAAAGPEPAPPGHDPAPQ